MTDDELRKTLLMSLSDEDVGRVLAHFTARIPTLLQVLLEERRSPSKSALLEFLKLYSVSR